MDKPNRQSDQQQDDTNFHQHNPTQSDGISPDLNTDNNARSHSDTYLSPNSRLSQIIMVIATVVIAISTTIYTLYAREQWQVMSNTLAEMKNSGDKTKTQTDRMITETNRIADAMTKTVQQSKSSLDATIQNFRLEQRAWVGPTQFNWAEYPEGDKKVHIKEGQQFMVGVTIVNSGKTPARKVKGAVRMERLSAGEKPYLAPSEAEKVLQETDAVMLPNMILALNPHPFNSIPSKSDIDILTSGKYVIYILGLITYEDIFERPHFTKFCMYLTPDLTGFKGCPNYNEAN